MVHVFVVSYFITQTFYGMLSETKAGYLAEKVLRKTTNPTLNLARNVHKVCNSLSK